MTTPVHCHRCGKVIANMIESGELELIQAAGLAIREVHGGCVYCGEAFHFNVNEKLIRRAGVIHLTATERMVLAVAERQPELADREVARMVSLSRRTVSIHRRLLERLGYRVRV